jgi:hypothetical protein
MYRCSIERSRCRYNRGSYTETEHIGRGLQTAATLNLLRGGGVEDNRTKTFSSLLSFTGVKGQWNKGKSISRSCGIEVHGAVVTRCDRLPGGRTYYVLFF